MKLGAVVVQKNKIVGKGHNVAFSTGHPRVDGIHAEISAINNATAKFRKDSTVIVGRLDKMGNLAIAKPCSACETILRKLGVKQVWYSTCEGWKKMNLQNMKDVSSAKNKDRQ